MGVTFDRLLRHEIMDGVLHAGARDRLGDGGREILVNDAPRRVRKLLLECNAHVADPAPNVNKEWGLRLQPMAKLLLERKDIEKYLLPLSISHHPLEEIVEARWHCQSPIERHLVGLMAFLEGTVGAIGWVLVLRLGKKVRQDLPTWQDVVVAGRF